MDLRPSNLIPVIGERAMGREYLGVKAGREYIQQRPRAVAVVGSDRRRGCEAGVPPQRVRVRGR